MDDNANKRGNGFIVFAAKIRNKIKKFWRELIVFAGSVGIVVLFVSVQDLSGEMVLVDQYTPSFLGLLFLIGGLFIVVMRRYRAEDKAKRDKDGNEKNR